MRTYWIWLAGAVAWWIDAAIALHYGHLFHAVLALVVALLFFVGAMAWRRKPTNPRA